MDLLDFKVRKLQVNRLCRFTYLCNVNDFKIKNKTINKKKNL